MRPKNLKSPFSWHERHILIQDRVWYIPGQFDDFKSFTFPGWHHPLTFEKDQPVCVEYCSGNGDWIASKAQLHPEYNWVAVEINYDRVRKIWSKIKNFQLSNLLIICGEGYCATREYFPSASIHDVYINFPDPWPKTRHAKNRLVQPRFLEETKRVLRNEGTLMFVTDDPVYSSETIQLFLKTPGFQSDFDAPYFVNDYLGYGTSYFEDLWREQGKDIRYHCFRHVKV